MMRAVPAPEGFEGSVHWNDGSRSWVASARPIGATWWTNVGGPFGHAYLTREEVDLRAAAHIARGIALGMVR
jgi:hypothetical protein